MINSLIAAVPHAGWILLRRRNVGVSVENIDCCIGSVRKGWNPYPGNDLTGDGIVLLHLIIQPGLPCRVRAEEDVVAVEAAHMAAVVDGGKRRVRYAEQEWEVRLVRIRHLLVMDDNGAREGITADPAFCTRGLLGQESDRGRGRLCRVGPTGRGDGYGLRRCKTGRRRIKPGCAQCTHSRWAQCPHYRGVAGVDYIRRELFRLTRIGDCDRCRCYGDAHGRQQSYCCLINLRTALLAGCRHHHGLLR